MNDKYFSRNNLELVIDGLKFEIKENLSPIINDLKEKDVIPNWNQNDPDTLDYIKNKPFYEGYVNLFDGDLTVNQYGSASFGMQLPVNAGQEYTIVVDDMSMTGAAHWTETEYTIGNGYYDENDNYIFGADNFAIYFSNWDNYPEGTVVHATVSTYDVKQIDEKFIPNNIVKNISIAQTTAETAQTTAETAQTTADKKMDATNPVGTGSFSMNRKAGTVVGVRSHAEGYNTTASGNYSHAEGYNTTASGDYSHAEGYNTAASGNYSHAEGYNTTASGDYSHAEGYNTAAISQYLSVSGKYNKTKKAYSSDLKLIKRIATSPSPRHYYSSKYEITEDDLFRLVEPMSGYKKNQEVLYMYTLESDDPSATKNTICHVELWSDSGSGYGHMEYQLMGKYAHIVGNGTSDTARSNAHTLDWEGNAWFAGDVYVGSTSGIDMDDGSKKLATEEYVNTSIANKITVPQNTVAGDLLTYDGTSWVRISKADLIADILLAMEESNKITFYINDEEYHADKNMTWHDWCNSNYNTSNFGNYYEAERISDADDHIIYEDEFVHGSDIIIANYKYTVRFDPTVDV